jgi:hypothetical protein
MYKSTKNRKTTEYEQPQKINVEVLRKKPNAFHLAESVIVTSPVTKVFTFIVKNLQTHYSKLAQGHKKFKVIGADEIAEGAVIDCEEIAGNQEVHHRYEVKRVVPHKLIHYSSHPSRAFVRTPWRTIEGESNTFVYYDFEEMTPTESRLMLTIVIQMPSFFKKFLATITGSGKLWANHLTEELHALKLEIENTRT